MTVRLRPWALWLAAAPFVFIGLGSRALWDDEAETAMLARSILAHGIPYAAHPGDPLISQESQREIGWNGLWTWTPWGQLYCAAASMSIFGNGSGAARMLFAIIGWIGLGIFYLAAKEFFLKEEASTELALFFVASSVPLLLHFRQCRWYALAFVELCLLWKGYWRMINRGSRGELLLIAGTVGLFYTQQFIFFFSGIAMLLAHLAFFRERTKEFVKPIVVAGAMCAPWLLLQTHLTPGRAYPTVFIDKLAYYVAEIGAHHLPLLVLLAWLALRGREGLDRRLGFCFLFIGAYVLLISLGPYPFFYRYLFPLIPALGLVQGRVWRDLLARVRRPAAGWALLVAAAGTNLLHRTLPIDLSGADHPEHSRLHLQWLELARELATPYRGPIAAMAEQLNAHAAKDDVVWVTYGELPLRFHTPLTRLYSGSSALDFAALPRPDWVILRAAEIFGPYSGGTMFHRFIAKTLDLRRDFEPVVLDAPDVPWDNRPEPDDHFFSTPQAVRPVVIYKRR